MFMFTFSSSLLEILFSCETLDSFSLPNNLRREYHCSLVELLISHSPVYFFLNQHHPNNSDTSLILPGSIASAGSAEANVSVSFWLWTTVFAISEGT